MKRERLIFLVMLLTTVSCSLFDKGKIGQEDFSPALFEKSGIYIPADDG
ncbi:MAG: hypothetical protein U9N85_07660 [Bacteroidota bacterium]|nr:hypothetical protein [Bacteroidota bacterium]